MSVLLKSIFVFMMCTTVTSTYFNWTRIDAIKGVEKTEADYQYLELKSFKDVSYVVGNFTFYVNFNQSDPSYYDYHIKYYMANEKIDPDKISESVTAAHLSVCIFFEWIYASDMLPMAHNHNDFDPNGMSVCPIQARTYHIYEIDKLSQLNADSDLPEGEHTVKIAFCKGDKEVGGFQGHFYSSDDELQ